VYAYLAGYILYKDTKSLLNKTCAVLISTFSIWNFVDVFSPSKDITEDTALLFQNISSIGWIGFASAALCFSLVFSKKERLLKSKKIILVILILPLFLIYKQWTNCIIIDPVRQAYGWSFAYTDTIWTYLFYAYYILFTLLAIYFIYRYGKKTDNLLEKKSAKIIIVAISISLIGGTIIDVVVPELGIFSIPPLANVFILIFAAGLVYTIAKYKFLTITPAIAAENIISAMDELLILLNQEGNIITVNKAALDSLQYEQKELEGKSVTVLFQEDKIKKNILEKITKKEVIKNQDSHFLTKNGNKVSIIYSSSLLKDEKGNIIGTVFIARDITEQKKHENELKDRELKLSTITNSAQDAIIMMDNSGDISFWNNAATNIFGWTEAEVLGKNLHKLLALESYHSAHFTAFPLFQKTGKGNAVGKTLELNSIRKDGLQITVELSLSSILLNNNWCAIGIIRDITKRKQAEYMLMLNKTHLSNALEIAHLGHWEYDVTNDIFIFNDQFFNIFHTTVKQVGGYTMSSAEYARRFVYPDDILVVGEEIRKAIETTDANFSRQIEHRMLYADGTVGYISVRFFIIKDVYGHTVSTFGVNQDITERKQAENDLIKAKEKAEESDRLKSAFLANMSHEIRTPMNGILGFAGLLKNSKLSGEKQQEFIEIIEKSGIRMLNIINDIINISKIDSGLMVVNISAVNLNGILKFIYSFFKLEVEQKGMQLIFNTNLFANNILIKTDKEKLIAVLTNLIKNAIKFTEKGFIEFGYKKNEHFLEFFIKDTGTGILPEQKEIIFERFRQGSESLTRNYEGSGLGLSISKAYIELLGGKIWVESESGKGSVFYFTIPNNVEDEEKIVNKIIKNIGEGNQLRNLKILIVEDDLTSIILLSNLLEPFSKEILTTTNGHKAIEICHKNSDIDLILMDICMEEMDGYEATMQIRQFNKDVVIIAETAFALAGDKEKAINVGCTDYISKPINQELLIELIKMHIKK